MTRIIVTDEFLPQLFDRMIAGKFLFERMSLEEFEELMQRPFESAIHNSIKALVYSIQLGISFEAQLNPIEPATNEDIVLLGECESAWHLTWQQANEMKINWWKITRV